MKNGITAPIGFLSAGVSCGIKKNNMPDLALIYSKKPCSAAGVFTTNTVKGHSLILTMEHLKDNTAQAIVINSGNANACIGEQGKQDALKMAKETASLLNIRTEDVLTASTGVIGHKLPMEKVLKGIKDASNALSENDNMAAKAIMTTDTVSKEYSTSFCIGGKKVTIGGMAKGSGMIHPNMATMISVLTTDADIDMQALKKAVKESCDVSFNKISVDGDTSVCDKYLILANGMSDCPVIYYGTEDYNIFLKELIKVSVELSKMIVIDGEGATKLIEINIKNAASKADAELFAKAVSKSPLVKTAFFGEDANWGRILTAIGYSGASFNVEKVSISIGPMLLFDKGKAVGFDEEFAKKVLSDRDITVDIDFNEGPYNDTMWTCDFSVDYVKINANYRT